MVAALLLLSHAVHGGEIRDFFARMPRLFFEKTRIRCPNEMKEEVIGQIMKKACLFEANSINITDGLRLEYDDAWMLIRASGTEPAIRLMSESTSRATTMKLIAAGVEAIHSCLARVEI